MQLQDIFNNSMYLMNDNIEINQEDLILIDDKSKEIIQTIENINSIIEIKKKEKRPLRNIKEKSKESSKKKEKTKKIKTKKKIRTLWVRKKKKN